MKTYTNTASFSMTSPKLLAETQNFRQFLLDDYTQFMLRDEVEIPPESEIREYLKTGKATDGMKVYISAVKGMLAEMSADIYLDMECEAMQDMDFEGDF